MSDTSPFGFGRFIPGFDFLQSLAKGAAGGVPGLPGWVAPTASVDELDKRIQELKAVQFWLEQNARALTATVQALEVQKMTLATLAGMNVAVGDMAAAFGAMGAGGAAAAPEPAPAPVAQPAPAPAPAAAAAAPAEGQEDGQGAPGGAVGMPDPLQWWGALTQQFQEIAARAVQDAATHQAAFDATRDMASGALKGASDMAAQWTQGGACGAAPAPAAKPRAGRAAPAGSPAKTTARQPAAKKRSQK